MNTIKVISRFFIENPDAKKNLEEARIDLISLLKKNPCQYSLKEIRDIAKKEYKSRTGKKLFDQLQKIPKILLKEERRKSQKKEQQRLYTERYNQFNDWIEERAKQIISLPPVLSEMELEYISLLKKLGREEEIARFYAGKAHPYYLKKNSDGTTELMPDPNYVCYREIIKDFPERFAEEIRALDSQTQDP